MYRVSQIWRVHLKNQIQKNDKPIEIHCCLLQFTWEISKFSITQILNSVTKFANIRCKVQKLLKKLCKHIAENSAKTLNNDIFNASTIYRNKKFFLWEQYLQKPMLMLQPEWSPMQQKCTLLVRSLCEKWRYTTPFRYSPQRKVSRSQIGE